MILVEQKWRIQVLDSFGPRTDPKTCKTRGYNAKTATLSRQLGDMLVHLYEAAKHTQTQDGHQYREGVVIE